MPSSPQMNLDFVFRLQLRILYRIITDSRCDSLIQTADRLIQRELYRNL
jgi:hypothetical protein